MLLIEPTIDYADRIMAYRQEFLDSGDSMDGTSRLRRFDRAEDWFEYLNRQKGEVSADGYAPAEQLIFVREDDGKIVGMADIRYVLNDYLTKFGGHIGYSVAPSERRKGYATMMLRMTLPRFRERGIDRILVTCDKSNEGSRRTIINNGGLYESTVYEPDEKIEVERYWITVPQ